MRAKLRRAVLAGMATAVGVAIWPAVSLASQAPDPVGPRHEAMMSAPGHDKAMDNRGHESMMSAPGHDKAMDNRGHEAMMSAPGHARTMHDRR